MDIKKLLIADIHLHLDGSLSSHAVIEIAKKENIVLPTYVEKELDKYLMVDENCASLNEYLTKFDVPNLVLQTKYGLKTAYLDLLKRESEAGLKYVEIRMAPQLSTQKGLSQEEVVKTLIDAKIEGEKLYKIKSNLILCLMRGATESLNLETINVARKYLGKGVVALDLAGAEALFPNELYFSLFKLAKEYNIPFVIHAGEASGANSVKTALEMGASRIGHGIHSIDDEKVIKMLVEKQIPLEICPKSNLDTKTISSFEQLPIKKFMEKGIKVTLNTDDMAVSNTTLENEYNILSNIGFSYEQLKLISLNTIDAAFLSEKEKEELKSYLK